MLHTILVISQIFVCLTLIVLILIQHGKGADMGAAFGSGASSTVFGSQGSGSFLTRTTAILATSFFVLSLTLAYFSTGEIEPRSVVETSPMQTQQPATPGSSELPAVPAESAPAEQSELPPSESSAIVESSTAEEAIPVPVADTPPTATDEAPANNTQ